MDPCRRCKNNLAVYECPICRCSYCAECDYYVHSFTSKKSHKRNLKNQNTNPLTTSNENKFNYNYPSLLSTNVSTFRNNTTNIQKNFQSPKCEKDDINEKNIFFYSQSPNNNFSPKHNEDIYEMDHNEIVNKISSLGTKINDTRDDLDQKIDHLHQHFHIMDENQKNEILELNYKNLKEINAISDDKDVQINRLEEIIQDQLNTIKELQLANENFQNKFQKNKEEINELYNEREKLLKENKQIEETYTEKLENVKNDNNSKIETIKNDYEDIYKSESEKIDNQKSKYNSLLSEKETNLNNLVGSNNEEIKKLEENILELEKSNILIKQNKKDLKDNAEKLLKECESREHQKRLYEEQLSRETEELKRMKTDAKEWQEKSKKNDMFSFA